MTLVNGPYNGREIDDSGAAVIRMALSTNGQTPGAKIGTALYEPKPDRSVAFWDRNEWCGTLDETISA
jgi:hypothetical protein